MFDTSDTNNVVTESPTAQGRRESRREEWTMQTEFTELLNEYLDPNCTFCTSIENKPWSQLMGILQKRRGVRSGMPDVMAVTSGNPQLDLVKLVFIELKSHNGVVRPVQKRVFAELTALGVHCWLARSTRAAMTALHRSGVPFRRQWRQSRLQPWEGPFNDLSQRMPMEPRLAAKRAAARRRWRERQASRVSTHPTPELADAETQTAARETAD